MEICKCPSPSPLLRLCCLLQIDRHTGGRAAIHEPHPALSSQSNLACILLSLEDVYPSIHPLVCTLPQGGQDSTEIEAAYRNHISRLEQEVVRLRKALQVQVQASTTAAVAAAVAAGDASSGGKEAAVQLAAAKTKMHASKIGGVSPTTLKPDLGRRP